MHRQLGILACVCALALAVGCGHEPIGSVTPLANAAPLSSSGSLLYVLDKLDGRYVSVYTFPGVGQHKHLVLPTESWAYICTDDRGNIYVPTNNVIFKYAHGGQRPIAYLEAQGAFGGQCAADPKTGDLAVDDGGGIKGCYVAIYVQAKGKPSCLKQIGVEVDDPTYDDQGDLFFEYGSGSTSLLGELPAGGSKIVKIAISESIKEFLGLQWDGTDIAIEYKEPGTLDQPYVISRIHISGTKGTIAKTIRFKDWAQQSNPFWISGSFVVAPLNYNELGIWPYPDGGKYVGTVPWRNPDVGWTVSVAP